MRHPRLCLSVGLTLMLLAASASAQQGTATDVLAGDITAFIDAVSDRPLRVIDVDDYRVNVYGVFRPKAFPRGAYLPMMDGKGRVWITQYVRPNDVPGWCLDGSEHPSAKYYPIQHRAESRQISYYDPDTEKFVLIDTYYFTHHCSSPTTRTIRSG